MAQLPDSAITRHRHTVHREGLQDSMIGSGKAFNGMPRVAWRYQWSMLSVAFSNPLSDYLLFLYHLSKLWAITSWKDPMVSTAKISNSVSAKLQQEFELSSMSRTVPSMLLP